MKRWVIFNPDNSLGIVCTSGHMPERAVCEAKEGWVADELSYNAEARLVFIDPAKLKIKDDERIRKQYELYKKTRYDKLKSKPWKQWAIYLISFALGVAVGLRF